MKLLAYIAGRPLAVDPTTLLTLAAQDVGEDATEAPLVHTAPSVIRVSGPLVAEPNCVSLMNGWASYAEIGSAVTAAADDPSVETIDLLIDSPGGDVTGCAELHALIRGVEKPTRARVSGLCASAAYWIACGCDTVVSAETSVVGSIGVYAAIPEKGADSTPGVVAVCASMTPRKGAAPDEDDQYQVVADELAGIFLRDVGIARGIPGSAQAVAQATLQGAIMPASKALALGLIDEISKEEGQMSLKNNPARRAAKALASAEAAPVAVERAEPEAIDGEEMAPEERIAQLEEELAAAIEKIKELEGEETEDEPEAEAPEAVVAASALQVELEDRDRVLRAMVADGKIRPADVSVAAAIYSGERAGLHTLWTAQYATRAAGSAVDLGRYSHSDEAPPPAEVAGAEATVHDRTLAHCAANKLNPNHPGQYRQAMTAVLAAK